MGTEVNLFRVEVKEPANFDKVDKALQEAGFTKVESEFDKKQNYEVSTKEGITEIQIINTDSKIERFFIRFSFGNPPFVIDQTIGLFKKLAEKLPIEIFDTTSNKLITLKEEHLTELRRLLLLRKNFFDIHRAKINIPMRGGKETSDYIHEYKKRHKNGD